MQYDSTLFEHQNGVSDLLICSRVAVLRIGYPLQFPFLVEEAKLILFSLVRKFVKINYDLLLLLYLVLLPSYVYFTGLINRIAFTVPTDVKLMSGSSVKKVRKY